MLQDTMGGLQRAKGVTCADTSKSQGSLTPPNNMGRGRPGPIPVLQMDVWHMHQMLLQNYLGSTMYPCSALLSSL